SQIHRPPRQPRRFGYLLRTVAHPTICLSKDVTPCRHAVRRGELRVQLDRSVKQPKGLVAGLLGHLMKAGHSPQEIIISIEVLCWLAPGPLDLGLFQFRRDCTNNACCYLVLKFEDVLDFTIEAVGPKMRSSRGINELPGYSQPISRFTHAAFKHVADAQLAPDLFHVDVSSLVRKARIARDDSQPAHM